MKEENLLFLRKNIESLPMDTNSETDQLIEQIVKNTSQVSVSKSDEIAVMQSMLNDKSFEVAIYNRTKGFLGIRSPRKTALSIINDALCGVTGMGLKEAEELTRDYEFSKRDASRHISIGKDFLSTYLQTGRKIVVTSSPRGESSINLKYSKAHNKTVPDQNSGKTKVVQTPAKIKLVASNKSM